MTCWPGALPTYPGPKHMLGSPDPVLWHACQPRALLPNLPEIQACVQAPRPVRQHTKSACEPGALSFLFHLACPPGTQACAWVPRPTQPVSKTNHQVQATSICRSRLLVYFLKAFLLIKLRSTAVSFIFIHSQNKLQLGTQFSSSIRMTGTQSIQPSLAAFYVVH